MLFLRHICSGILGKSRPSIHLLLLIITQLYLRTHKARVFFCSVVLQVTLGYRQAALLLREVKRFQEAHGLQHWPCFIAGGE